MGLAKRRPQAAPCESTEAAQQGHLLPRRALVGLTAAAASVGVAYGVLLPVLPGAVAALAGGDERATSWQTGLVTAAFTAAPLAFAPVWGWVSDRIGRRPALLAGLLGLAAALGATPWAADHFGGLYLVRFLAGASSAAAAPTALALIADSSPAPDQRARRFALFGAGTTAGLFAGPMLGGLASSWAPPGGAIAMSPLGAAALLSAVGVAGAAALVAGTVPRAASSGTATTPRGGSDGGGCVQSWLPALALVGAALAAVVAMFEVALALRAHSKAVPPAELGLMFATCSLLMGVAQAVILSGRFGPAPLSLLVAPALWTLAASLALLPLAEGTMSGVLGVAAVAISAGAVAPVLGYFASFAAGTTRGAELGRQSAATSLGQTLGSAAGGAFTGLPGGPDVAFLAAASAAAAAAVVSVGWIRRLGSAIADEAMRQPSRCATTSTSGGLNP